MILPLINGPLLSYYGVNARDDVSAHLHLSTPIYEFLQPTKSVCREDTETIVTMESEGPNPNFTLALAHRLLQ